MLMGVDRVLSIACSLSEPLTTGPRLGTLTMILAPLAVIQEMMVKPNLP